MIRCAKCNDEIKPAQLLYYEGETVCHTVCPVDRSPPPPLPGTEQPPEVKVRSIEEWLLALSTPDRVTFLKALNSMMAWRGWYLMHDGIPDSRAHASVCRFIETTERLMSKHDFDVGQFT